VGWKKDADPAVVEDANTFWVLVDMLKWGLVSGWWRSLVQHLYPTTRCFWDVSCNPGVHGLVALTIDDCFCRQDGGQETPEEHSMIRQVQQVLAAHEAKATFFCTLQYSTGEWRERVRKLSLSLGPAWDVLRLLAPLPNVC
jgi:hypothetical protein